MNSLATQQSGPASGRGSPTLEQVASPANLYTAWERVRDNDGAPGPDRMTVDAYAWFVSLRLWWLRCLLITRFYRPGPLRTVYIPKKDGGTRRLDIPSIRDRVVGTALNLALTPMYERHFLSSSHGYRPGRGVETALRQIRRHVSRGWTWVLDADIRSCFPSISHRVLLRRLSEDLADPRVIALIRRLLTASIPWFPWLLGRRRGCPQGSPLSPLLCNRMLHELDVHAAQRGLKLVRYADDFVVLCRTRADAEAAREMLRGFLRELLDLELHPEKTRVLPARDLHFLGQDLFGSRPEAPSLLGRLFRWLFRRERPSRPGGASVRD